MSAALVSYPARGREGDANAQNISPSMCYGLQTIRVNRDRCAQHVGSDGHLIHTYIRDYLLFLETKATSFAQFCVSCSSTVFTGPPGPLVLCVVVLQIFKKDFVDMLKKPAS